MINIVQNKEELRAYTCCVRQTSSHKGKCRAKVILIYLSNPMNFLYLTFALPLIMGFQQVNSFQATNCAPEQKGKELNMHYQSLMDKVYTRLNILLPIDHIKFGAKFMHETREYLKQGDTPEHQVMIIDIKKKCHTKLPQSIQSTKPVRTSST